MSLREEMWKYEQITGESAEHVPIIKLGAFLDGYEMGIKALEQTRWIPVSEKLPEPNTAVLLYVKYKSSGQWTYQLGMWDDNKLAWEDWRTPYQLEEEFEVIAWMELPEIYEEDTNE